PDLKRGCHVEMIRGWHLGYQTYVCFPLELALGHLGPLLAATLYTVLTRLGEAGLEALGAALRQGLGTEATERFLAEVRRFSQAAGVRLVGRDGHRAELGWLPPCGMRDCPAWRGQVVGLKTGLPDCPEAEGRPRICLPFWAHGEVVAVGTLGARRDLLPRTSPRAGPAGGLHPGLSAKEDPPRHRGAGRGLLPAPPPRKALPGL
ncbi:MAG: hypothetical protein ACP5P8_11170, partial [Thermus sp.]